MYLGKNSKVIVQGITGSQGKFHSKLMQDYGTNIVAGVTPNKGGQQVHGIPVYNTVFETVKEKNADTIIIFERTPTIKGAGSSKPSISAHL